MCFTVMFESSNLKLRLVTLKDLGKRDQCVTAAKHNKVLNMHIVLGTCCHVSGILRFQWIVQETGLNSRPSFVTTLIVKTSATLNNKIPSAASIIICAEDWDWNCRDREAVYVVIANTYFIWRFGCVSLVVKRDIIKLCLFKLNLTLMVEVNHSTPQNNRDLNQGVLYPWSKFGDSSLNG